MAQPQRQRVDNRRRHTCLTVAPDDEEKSRQLHERLQSLEGPLTDALDHGVTPRPIDARNAVYTQKNIQPCNQRGPNLVPPTVWLFVAFASTMQDTSRDESAGDMNSCWRKRCAAGRRAQVTMPGLRLAWATDCVT